jgi:ATP-dependent exoDNAse (exonuclease V) beta subunit
VLGLLAAIAVIDDADRQLDLWMALKSPVFACDDTDLLRHRRAGGYWRITDASDAEGRVADSLAVLHAIRRGSDSPQPVAVVDALLRRTRLMEALSFAPRGAFDADCVRMLRAHAQQWQDDGGVGLADYLVAAAEVQTDSTRAGLAEPDDRDDNAVRLMTVHQAKGLEFPIVVLAGMASNIYEPSPTIGVVTPEHFEFSINKDLRSVGYSEWDETLRKARSDAERMRLDYVACTRARDHVIVSVCGEHGKRKRTHSSLLWDAIPAKPEDVTTLEIEAPVAAPVTPTPAPPLPSAWTETVDAIRRRTREPFVASPSGDAAVALGLSVTASTGPALTEPVPLETEVSSAADARAARDGRPLGRAVHAALDGIVRIGEAVTSEQVSAICVTAADDEGIASQAGEVHARVTNGLATDLMHEALAAPRRWSELYLSAPVTHLEVRLVEGFADLVFESVDGLVLVDYKTDELLSPETLPHYREQLATYAKLIELATQRAVSRRAILRLTQDGADTLD